MTRMRVALVLCGSGFPAPDGHRRLVVTCGERPRRAALLMTGRAELVQDTEGASARGNMAASPHRAPLARKSPEGSAKALIAAATPGADATRVCVAVGALIRCVLP